MTSPSFDDDNIRLFVLSNNFYLVCGTISVSGVDTEIVPEGGKDMSFDIL